MKELLKACTFQPGQKGGEEEWVFVVARLQQGAEEAVILYPF